MDEKDKKNEQERGVDLGGNIQLWGLLDQTAFAVGRNRDIELKHYGLTPAQSAVLYVLEKNNGQATQHKISNFSMRQLNSVSTLISKMVALELVEKIQLPNSSRSQVRITKKGREIYANSGRDSVKMIYSVLSEEEKELYNNILKKLLQKARNLLGIDYKPPFIPSNACNTVDEKDKKNAQESIVDLEGDLQLWALLDQTDFAIARNREIELKHYGLTPTQSAVLYALEKNNGQATQNKISNFSMRHLHSVSPLLKKMVNHGLVEKVKLPNSSWLQVRITKKGREIYANSGRNSVKMIFSVLSKEEKEFCNSILKKLLQKAKNLLGIDYKPPFLPSNE